MGKSSVRPTGRSLGNSSEERRPIMQRAEIIVVALVGFLLITIIICLYLAKTLFMPIIAAFVVGTMLSAGARFLEKYRIPRVVSAVLMVAATWGIFVLIVSLISAPLLEWTSQVPELSLQLKQKLHVFDRPIALWNQLQSKFGVDPSDAVLPWTKIEWIQPTLEFLSPTLTEFSLFFVTLILFVSSWPDLRRTLIMTFATHETRLRTLRILNAIENQLGSYLLTVTIINISVGIVVGLICSLTGVPNPAGLGALAAILNYIPIIGPVVMFAILLAVGFITGPTVWAGLIAPSLFAGMTFLEGHFITPMIIGRRLELNVLAVFIVFAFWTWLWGPIGAFLASPMLIVIFILKEHLLPTQEPQLPA